MALNVLIKNKNPNISGTGGFTTIVALRGLRVICGEVNCFLYTIIMMMRDVDCVIILFTFTSNKNKRWVTYFNGQNSYLLEMCSDAFLLKVKKNEKLFVIIANMFNKLKLRPWIRTKPQMICLDQGYMVFYDPHKD